MAQYNTVQRSERLQSVRTVTCDMGAMQAAARAAAVARASCAQAASRRLLAGALA